MASKRHNKITRTGWRYIVCVLDHRDRQKTDHVTLSRRNDKAVTDFFLALPGVASVEIRSLCKCVYAMDPEDYYEGSEIIQMQSVIID